MATYNLTAADLVSLLNSLEVPSSLDKRIDHILRETGNYPTGKLVLPAQVEAGVGQETISVSDSIGLFIEKNSGVFDTLSFYPSSSGGHVIFAGDGDSVSIFDPGAATYSDTLIAGFQSTLPTHQTLSVDHGNNYLLGGLHANASDLLRGGDGSDTLKVSTGTNVLIAGTGHQTLDGGSRGADTMFLGVGGGGYDVVNGGKSNESITSFGGHDTINVATGSMDTINVYGGDVKIHISSAVANVTETKNVAGGYDQFKYGTGSAATVVDVTPGGATIYFTDGQIKS